MELGGQDERSRSLLSLLREDQEALLVVPDLLMEMAVMGTCDGVFLGSGELGM